MTVYRLAAGLTILRMVVVLPLAAEFGEAREAYLAIVILIHVVVAIGYLRRATLAILFGMYAAAMGLLSPLILPLQVDGTWLAVHAVVSLVWVGVALAALRDWLRHRSAADASG